MAFLQLAETLPVRYHLNVAGAKNELIALALDTLEKFVDRLKSGFFRLRPEQEAQRHMDDIRQALSAISATEPGKVTVSTHSLAQLIDVDPTGQLVLYALGEGGSVARVLDRAPHDLVRDRAHEIECRNGPRNCLHALIKQLLVDAKLLDVLFETRYGGFARTFENNIITYFNQLFAYAITNHCEMVGRLLPVAKLFRTNMPIGRLPLVGGDTTHHWAVFTE